MDPAETLQLQCLPCPSTSHHHVARRESGIAEKIPPGKGGKEKSKCMHLPHGQQFREGTHSLPCQPVLARDTALSGRRDAEPRQEEPPSFPSCRTAPRPLFKALGPAANALPPSEELAQAPVLPGTALPPGPPTQGAGQGKSCREEAPCSKMPGNCPLLETARHGQEDGETSSHLPLVFFFFLMFECN